MPLRYPGRENLWEVQIVTATGQRGLNSGPVRAMDSGQLRT